MENWKQNNIIQWKQISFVLKNRQKSATLWISCDNYSFRQELLNEFFIKFPSFSHKQLSLKNFNENNLDSFFNNQLPSKIFNQKDNKWIIHLTDIESQIFPHLNKEGKKGHFMEVLNFEREIIFNKFHFIVVFWSETHTQIQVQNLAADFWDWLTYKFNFIATI